MLINCDFSFLLSVLDRQPETEVGDGTVSYLLTSTGLWLFPHVLTVYSLQLFVIQKPKPQPPAREVAPATVKGGLGPIHQLEILLHCLQTFAPTTELPFAVDVQSQLHRHRLILESQGRPRRNRFHTSLSTETSPTPRTKTGRAWGRCCSPTFDDTFGTTRRMTTTTRTRTRMKTGGLGTQRLDGDSLLMGTLMGTRWRAPPATAVGAITARQGRS